MNNIYEFLNVYLGLDVEVLNFWHMFLRGIGVFVLGFFLIKINKRFLGQRTEFNFILFIMFGSILATAITGNAPFFPVLGMSIVLFALNWILIKLSFHFRYIEKLLKGEPILLIKDGQFEWKTMKKYSMTPDDLSMHLRLNHGHSSIKNVEIAYMEPNGNISFVLKK